MRAPRNGGIGSWANEGYSAEFGSRRRYASMPYYSDLSRFSRCVSRRSPGEAAHGLVMLYSGSLSERKGVDLIPLVWTNEIDGDDSGCCVIGASGRFRMGVRVGVFWERQADLVQALRYGLEYPAAQARLSAT